MTRQDHKIHRLGRYFAVFAAILLLAGCASVPPPTGSLSQAGSLLASAEAAGAATWAPLELSFAMDKLEKARAAMSEEDYELAAALAAESQVNSELARVKSELGKVREQIENLIAENQRAREQLLGTANQGAMP